MTMASSRLGSVRAMSIKRMMAISRTPRIEAGDEAEERADQDRYRHHGEADRVSDSRAPWIERERISRPIASVPSG